MPHRATASTWLTGAAIWLVAVVVLLRAVSPSTIRYDYQRAFYAAGTAVLEHQSLYASALHQLETKASSPSLSPYERAHTYIPYLYPPPYALFLAGLSAMPYEAAARVFYWINVAFLVLIALLIGYALGSRRRWFLASALVFAALVGFTPIRSTLHPGQADLVILVPASPLCHPAGCSAPRACRRGGRCGRGRSCGSRNPVHRDQRTTRRSPPFPGCCWLIGVLSLARAAAPRASDGSASRGRDGRARRN